MDRPHQCLFPDISGARPRDWRNGSKSVPIFNCVDHMDGDCSVVKRYLSFWITPYIFERYLKDPWTALEFGIALISVVVQSGR